MSEMKDGKISISRPQGNDTDYIQIEFYDDASGTQFLTAQIALDVFAEALTGLGHSPCKFDLRPSLVGKLRQHKEETVPWGGRYVRESLERIDIASEAFAPFEVDGWTGRVDDLFNHHRKTANGYRVLFTRYVDAEPSEHN